MRVKGINDQGIPDVYGLPDAIVDFRFDHMFPSRCMEDRVAPPKRVAAEGRTILTAPTIAMTPYMEDNRP